eukprot:353460-Chlamydomonas_euryale.AAC.8
MLFSQNELGGGIRAATLRTPSMVCLHACVRSATGLQVGWWSDCLHPVPAHTAVCPSAHLHVCMSHISDRCAAQAFELAVRAMPPGVESWVWLNDFAGVSLCADGKRSQAGGPGCHEHTCCGHRCHKHG